MIHLHIRNGPGTTPRHHEAGCESLGWASAGSQQLPNNCLLSEVSRAEISIPTL